MAKSVHEKLAAYSRAGRLAQQDIQRARDNSRKLKRLREIDRLRRSLRAALRRLPEVDAIDVITQEWLSLDRLDRLKERFP